MKVTRRGFITTGTAAAVGGLIGAGSASAAESYRGAKPDHVTLRYDETEMQRHQPAVIDPQRPSSDEQAQKMHGWIAESPEHELDCFVYFTYYKTQRGSTRWDSHRYDREPVYCFVDPSHDEVREITYSAYHWSAAHEDEPPTATVDGQQRVTLRIVQPHNQYVLSKEDPEEYEVLSLESLGTQDGYPFDDAEFSQTTYETWLDTGWRGTLEPGVVQDPWRMQSRDSWLKDGHDTLIRRIWTSAQLTMARAGISNPRIVGSAPDSDLS